MLCQARFEVPVHDYCRHQAVRANPASRGLPVMLFTDSRRLQQPMLVRASDLLHIPVAEEAGCLGGGVDLWVAGGSRRAIGFDTSVLQQIALVDDLDLLL